MCCIVNQPIGVIDDESRPYARVANYVSHNLGELFKSISLAQFCASKYLHGCFIRTTLSAVVRPNIKPINNIKSNYALISRRLEHFPKCIEKIAQGSFFPGKQIRVADIPSQNELTIDR